MNTPITPTTESVEIGHWPIGTETIPVMVRVVAAGPESPGGIELWALDLRLMSLSIEEDGVVIRQHEDAPGGEVMAIVPLSINEVYLPIDLGRLKRLAEVPDTP